MEFFDQHFDPTTGAPDAFPYHDFEQCTFKNLPLGKAVLANSNFVNCRFESCNLDLALVKGTKFNDVSFVKCTLVGVNFEHCNPFAFSVGFEECNLDQSYFFNRNLKKTKLIGCSLKGASFINCDLAGAVFKDCNLELTVFVNNTLTQVDFSTSYNLTLDPEQNKLKKAKFSLHSLPGLLTKYDLVIR
ncbi:pentapeptide repeat-containing protein [Larkinella rosea]|uniref:Pentapeptide repeat-containing protein n=1 Tax=Larkinella rosea TaxID=2025312 RepID=A0A3P1B9K3_9BACT|nr:pentapeptide repeat-containing protein [Larkinella rosea]RRA97728.1 pentapeptide repeat-containing protein [Larkinella rosea]